MTTNDRQNDLPYIHPEALPPYRPGVPTEFPEPRPEIVPSAKIGEVHLLGPPGCGKTHALTTTWLPKAIARYGRNAVVVLSLTKAAALEISARQVEPLDPLRVRTLHSMCHGIMRDRRDFDVVRTDAASDIRDWNEHVSETPGLRRFRLGVARMSPGARITEDMFSEIDYARSALLPMTGLRSDAQALANAWRRWKAENQLMDFTDLVEAVLSGRAKLPVLHGVAAQALIVDEAQDLSALDFALIRQWGQDLAAVVLAGDADQAIYEFRGAAPRTFHDPTTWGGKTFELRQSFRVPEKVANYAESWHTRGHPARVGVQYEPRVSERAGEVVRSPNAMSRAGWDAWPASERTGFVALVKDEIELLDSYALEGDHRTVMILAAEGYLLSDALSALKESKIRYHNPYKPSNGVWNPAGVASGALRAFARLSDEDQWTWADLRKWTGVCSAAQLLKRSVRTKLRDLDDEVLRDFVTDEDMEELFAHPDDVRAIASELSSGNQHGAIDWLVGLMTTKGAEKMVDAVKFARAHGLEAYDEEPRVVIGTIHSVKGATAGTVILSPDMSHRRYHGRKKHPGSIARLFYVGMTRSSERLILMRTSSAAASAVSW